MHRRLVSLVMGLAVFSFPTIIQADVVVESSIQVLQLQILPTVGTVNFVSPWTANVSVSAEDSVSGASAKSGSQDDGSESLSVGTAYASASGTASTASTPYSANATSGVNIPNLGASASSFSNGDPEFSAFGEFEITGTTGPVNVVFQAPLSINQSVTTTGGGLAARSEVIFTLLSPAFTSGGSNTLLSFDNILSIGPSDHQSLTTSPTEATGMISLDANTPYFLGAAVDAESFGVSTPEPSFFVATGLGLTVLLFLNNFRGRRNQKRSLLQKHFWICAALVFLGPELAHATYIGAESPICKTCPACSSCLRPLNSQPSNTSSSVSDSEGNVIENVPISMLPSNNGPTLDLTLTYNSYNADNSRTTLDTVVGYGWTHSFNPFLFGQLGSMFRFDGNGRVTRYSLGPGGTFTAATGYFETLTQSGSTFTLTYKDKTTYTFQPITGTPFLVGGQVYRLTQIIDRNGNTTTFSYSSGNLTSVTDTYGRTITFSYNSQGHLSSVADPVGRTTTFQYDSTGHLLTKITDPNGRTIQYTYNTLYQITGKVDKAGRTFRYSYNSSFLPVAVNDSSNKSPFTLSNPSNWATDPTQLSQNQLRVYIPSTTTNTDGRGNKWQYQYDSNGYLLETIAPDGATTKYTYDPNTLQLASMTDANGHTTSYIYNSEGDLLQVMDAMGNVTKYTYESTFNMMTSMTDALGRVTTYTIDPSNGNKTEETDPLGQTQRWSYDGNGNVTQYTDKNGNITKYVYLSGNLVQEIDAFGTSIQSTTSFAYDGVGNRIQMTDALGRVTTYQYDGMNRLIQETDAVGTAQQRTIQIVYDGEGNRVEVIDGRGIVTQYQYDLRQRLILETDAVGTPDLRTITTTYDGNDNRITLTDPNGHITTYAYDTRNRVIHETDATGTGVQATTLTAYDAVSNVISTTDANGHTTTNAYDSLNRRTSITDALGEETLYFYDGGQFIGSVTLGSQTVTCNMCGATPGSSLVTGKVDPDGTASLHAGTTYFFYDALNRLVIQDRKTGCIGGPSGTGCSMMIDTSDDAVTLFGYDSVGNRVQYTEPDGNTTNDQYDAKNRLIKDVNAAGDTTITTYDLVNNVLTVTAPNGNVTTNTYDALNRVIQVTDSIGLVETDAYDADNNRTSHGDGDGNITTYAYDALNRMVTSTDPLGKTMTTTYDPVGNVLSITDRNSNTTTYTYDALNRRSTMTDALGNVTKWQYDPVGNLTELTDANLHSTKYNYDAVNRPLCETYADGTKRCYTYDPAGNLIERQDAIAGQTVTYTYNDLYFLIKRAYTPSGAQDTFTYDLSGRMLTNQRANGTFTWPESFTYDGANRLTKSVQDGQIITYSYNIPSRMRTLTYPGGREITEYTDARTRMDHIDNNISTTPSIVQYAYDLANNILNRNYNNSTTSSLAYNANNWITNVTHSNGGGPFATFNYAYDNEGNKQYEQKVHDPSHSECYGYDVTYRLITYESGTLGTPNPCPVVSPPVPPTQTSYSLDPVGNWKSKTTNGVTETRTHNSVNEITEIDSTPLHYDSDGDLTNDGTYKYTFDEEHRLTSVTRITGSVVVGQYEYDVLSRRVQKIANPTGASSTTTLYLYDDARIIEEQNTSNVTQATYVYGNYIDEVLTMDRGGSTYYYHQNALWSVVAITNSAGNPVERYRYDAYGEPTITDGSFNPIPPNSWGTPHSAIGNPWMFTGREFDEETGLYYYRARYYDPVKGRFLERDPVEYIQSMNLYQYSLNNPINWLDPLGSLAVYGGILQKGDEGKEDFRIRATLRVTETVDEMGRPCCTADYDQTTRVTNSQRESFVGKLEASGKLNTPVGGGEGGGKIEVEKSKEAKNVFSFVRREEQVQIDGVKCFKARWDIVAGKTTEYKRNERGEAFLSAHYKVVEGAIKVSGSVEWQSGLSQTSTGFIILTACCDKKTKKFDLPFGVEVEYGGHRPPSRGPGIMIGGDDVWRPFQDDPNARFLAGADLLK